MRRVWIGLLVGAALALPLASATPGHGAFEALSLSVEDGLDYSATAGDVAIRADTFPEYGFTAASVEVTRLGERTIQHALPLVPSGTVSSEPVNEKSSFGAAEVLVSPGSAEQWLGMQIRGPVTGQGDLVSIQPVAGAFLISPRPHESADCEREDCIQSRGAYAFTTADGAADFSGDLLLIAFGPSLRVTAAGEETTFASGETSRTDGPLVQTEKTWITLRATDVSGRLIHTEGVTWFLPSPTLSAGQARIDQAAGEVEIGRSAYRAQKESVELIGSLTLAFEPVQPGALNGPAGAEDVTIAYAESFSVRVSGDVQSINLRASPVFSQVAAAPLGIAALFAAVAGLAVYLWPQIQFHGASALLPLYSRIKQPELLDNEVRNNIYEIIRGNPGISAREVHRRSSQSWGTVVYHLRQLERHHLVVSRSVGRTRNYYENHGKYRGMEVQLACLQSGRARALAHVVLASPGITQEDLVARSGFPQPTTSYYVRKLKVATLVEERREGRYARYYPHAELARFLQLAESSVQPALGFADAGVDA